MWQFVRRFRAVYWCPEMKLPCIKYHVRALCHFLCFYVTGALRILLKTKEDGACLFSRKNEEKIATVYESGIVDLLIYRNTYHSSLYHRNEIN